MQCNNVHVLVYVQLLVYVQCNLTMGDATYYVQCNCWIL
jgi:hypothetical protein